MHGFTSAVLLQTASVPAWIRDLPVDGAVVQRPASVMGA